MDFFTKRVTDSRFGHATLRHNNDARRACTSILRAYPYVDHARVPNEFESVASLARPYTKMFQVFSGLHTERLFIRKVSMSDVLDLYDYSKDEQVAQYVLWHAHKTPKQSRDYIAFLKYKYLKGQPASYGMILKETGKLIGTIGFMSLNVENASADVGYSLKRSYWNQGLVTEALGALLEFGFFALGLNRIEAVHECDNPASGRVLQKVGMSYEGKIRHKFYNKGRFVDVYQYAILHEDFRKLKKQQGELC